MDFAPSERGLMWRERLSGFIDKHIVPAEAEYRAQVFWRDPRAPWPDTLTPLTWVEQLPAHHPRWSGEAWRAHVAGFGLAMHLHKPMYQLSSGSQRKVLLAAFLCTVIAFILKFSGYASLVQTPLPLIAVITFSMGVSSILMGLLAEVTTRTYFESQGKPSYKVKRMINVDKKSGG